MRRLPLLLGWAGAIWVGVAFSPVYPEDPTKATELNNQAIQEARAGHLLEAIDLLRRALALDPDDPLFRKNLSFALSDRADQLQGKARVEEALSLLQEATTLHPTNGPAFIRLGNLYYLELNDFTQAIAAWKRAHGLIPSAQRQAIADRIAQVERDAQLERRFLMERSEHFQIRFQEPSDREAALRVGEVLEAAYQRLQGEMGQAPSNLTVILYGGKEFKRLAPRRDWSLGFYDGRIRIRREEVGTPRESWLLAHELAHAFLFEIYGSRIPIWVHEGYAQLQETGRVPSPREEELFQRVASRSLWVPLAWLDSHFERPSGSEDVERAYVQARAAVTFLTQRYGIKRFREFLQALSSGEPMEQAFDRWFAPSRWSRVNQGILE